MPKIHNEKKKIKILTREEISITDFAFAQTPAWHSAVWHCYGCCLYLKF